MLSENIKTLRRTKELSQEEPGIKLNVVRQTVSKWEHSSRNNRPKPAFSAGFFDTFGGG